MRFHFSAKMLFLGIYTVKFNLATCFRRLETASRAANFLLRSTTFSRSARVYLCCHARPSSGATACSRARAPHLVRAQSLFRTRPKHFSRARTFLILELELFLELAILELSFAVELFVNLHLSLEFRLSCHVLCPPRDMISQTGS